MYSFIEPADFGNVIEKRWTTEDILTYYYPDWCLRMKDAGKEHLISEERCIEDWVMVYWAKEVEDEEGCDGT